MNIQDFDVHLTRGFLPSSDPFIGDKNSTFGPFHELARNLPKLLTPNLLVADKLPKAIKSLPNINLSELDNEMILRAVMRDLSFLAHAYIWQNWRGKPETVIPQSIAVPWHQVAKKLGRPPILSYASYALDNWLRIDPKKPIELGNIVLIRNFYGGIDEEWFVLIHVAIEAAAGKAMSAIPKILKAVKDDIPATLLWYLIQVKESQQMIQAILERMPENCDPYAYYHRVRPFINGFKDHPVVYEGVEEYHGKPQCFRGETGAQSGIIPALDALFGVEHTESPLTKHLLEMRDYMPVKHRAFLEAIEKGPSVRDYIMQRKSQLPELKMFYDICRENVAKFRDTHMQYAKNYIHCQHQASKHNPTEVGTGGTPFMPSLQKHLDETKQ